jgi:hypothetical protein
MTHPQQDRKGDRFSIFFAGRRQSRYQKHIKDEDLTVR